VRRVGRSVVLLGRVDARADRSTELAERDAQGIGDAPHRRPCRVRGAALDAGVSSDGQPGPVREIFLSVAALLAQRRKRFLNRGVARVDTATEAAGAY
jgi:hypothetical protein